MHKIPYDFFMIANDRTISNHHQKAEAITNKKKSKAEQKRVYEAENKDKKH